MKNREKRYLGPKELLTAVTLSLAAIGPISQSVSADVESTLVEENKDLNPAMQQAVNEIRSDLSKIYMYQQYLSDANFLHHAVDAAIDYKRQQEEETGEMYRILDKFPHTYRSAVQKVYGELLIERKNKEGS